MKKDAVATTQTYAVVKHDPEQLRAIMAANVGGAKVSEFDLDRVKMPTAGGRIWMIPGLNGDEDSKTIEGVIVAWREPRTYWKEALDVSGGGAPPDCSAADGIHGVGDPGGNCGACPLAQFGSAMRDGKPSGGQACKQTRLLFMVRTGDLIPLVVTAPPTSLRGLRRYFLRLASREIPYYGLTTRLELEQDKSKDGFTYSKIAPIAGELLSDEDRVRMQAYAEMMAPVFGRVTVESSDVEGE